MDNVTKPGEPISTRVIEAVSRASGTDPNELPPLYEAVDPDALDMLFPVAADASDRSDCSLRFTYAGHEVEVTAPASITVRADGDLDTRRSPPSVDS
jgi:hypothetical protein